MAEGFTTEGVKTTQTLILEGIVTLLRAEFSDWDSTAIYISDRPDPENVNQNLSRFIQVTQGGGSFNQSVLSGGSRCEETAYIGVTVWRRCESDQAGRAIASLTNSTDGLFKVKQRILKALTGKMLSDGDGKYLTTGTIKPTQALDPETGSSESPLDSLGVTFAVPFDWDLS